MKYYTGILLVLGCLLIFFIIYVSFNYGLPDSHIEKESFSYKLKYFIKNFWLSIPVTIAAVIMYPFYSIMNPQQEYPSKNS
jgi:hypothetical protein